MDAVEVGLTMDVIPGKYLDEVFLDVIHQAPFAVSKDRGRTGAGVYPADDETEGVLLIIIHKVKRGRLKDFDKQEKLERKL